MLKAPFIGFAFDVQHNPARLRIAVCWPSPAHRLGIRLEVRGWTAPGKAGGEGQNESGEKNGPGEAHGRFLVEWGSPLAFWHGRPIVLHSEVLVMHTQNKSIRFSLRHSGDDRSLG